MYQRTIVPVELLLSFLAKANEEGKVRFKFINQCAPLIKGIKPSSFILILIEQWYLWNQLVLEYNLHVSILHMDNKRVAVLLYDIDQIKQFVLTSEKMQYLDTLGYKTKSFYGILDQLSIRLKEYYEDCAPFPHELGIILGYPVCDVIGFMKHTEELYTGYWKVYSNVKETLALFQKYDNARYELMVELFKKP